MHDLALQVRQVDRVVVDEDEVAHSARGEVHRDRRPEAAEPDEEHAGGPQAFLSLDPDLGQHDLAVVPQELLVAELEGWSDGGGSGGGHGGQDGVAGFKVGSPGCGSIIGPPSARFDDRRLPWRGWRFRDMYP